MRHERDQVKTRLEQPARSPAFDAEQTQVTDRMPQLLVLLFLLLLLPPPLLLLLLLLLLLYQQLLLPQLLLLLLLILFLLLAHTLSWSVFQSGEIYVHRLRGQQK